MHPPDARAISNFIFQALTGQDTSVFGDGSRTRAFCYVDNLIDGLVRMMATEDAITGPVNLSNPVAVRALAERVIAITGARSRIVYRPLPQDDPQQRCPDIHSGPARTGLAADPRAGGRSRQRDRLFRGAADRPRTRARMFRVAKAAD